MKKTTDNEMEALGPCKGGIQEFCDSQMEKLNGQKGNSVVPLKGVILLILDILHDLSIL